MKPDASDKLLRRLLKRKPLADLIARGEFRNFVIVDPGGAVLAGDPAGKTGGPAEIAANGRVVGHVYGEDAPRLANLLNAFVELSVENRALATESLEKYRELSMLYNVSEKLLAAPDINGVAALVCDEAQRFLRSDSVSVLLLN
jgi:hypothetical protein